MAALWSETIEWSRSFDFRKSVQLNKHFHAELIGTKKNCMHLFYFLQVNCVWKPTQVLVVLSYVE